MTIAAGFNCSDGIVLASDTQYSATQNTHGPKLWVVREDDPSVVFGGAARTVAALTRARDEIGLRLKAGLSVSQTVDAIDDALKKVNKLFPYPNWVDVQALAVIRADGQNRLYQNVKGQVALSPVDQPSVCVGVDTLGDYFTLWLFKKNMSMRWAKMVAAHMIANCKTYASGYCGRLTHVIEIPNDGAIRRIGDDEQHQIADLEAYLGPLQEVIRMVLPREETSEPILQARLNTIHTAIAKALRWHQDDDGTLLTAPSNPDIQPTPFPLLHPADPEAK